MVSPDKKGITAIEIGIIEETEIFAHHDFDPENKFNTVPQSYSLLVKWLFDNRYLKLPEEVYNQELNLDHADILAFTQAHLKNHIWDTQIKEIPYLRAFLFKISSNSSVEGEGGERINFYMKNLFIKVAGKWEEHQEIYEKDILWVEDFEREVFLDEGQAREFLAVLTEYFSLFGRLTREK